MDKDFVKVVQKMVFDAKEKGQTVTRTIKELGISKTHYYRVLKKNKEKRWREYNKIRMANKMISMGNVKKPQNPGIVKEKKPQKPQNPEIVKEKNPKNEMRGGGFDMKRQLDKSEKILQRVKRLS